MSSCKRRRSLRASSRARSLCAARSVSSERPRPHDSEAFSNSQSWPALGMQVARTDCSVKARSSRRRDSEAPPPDDTATFSTNPNSCRKEAAISATSSRVAAAPRRSPNDSETSLLNSRFKRSATSRRSCRVTASARLGDTVLPVSSRRNSEHFEWISSSRCFLHLRKRDSAASVRATCTSTACWRPLMPPLRSANWPSSRGYLLSTAATFACRGSNMVSMSAALWSWNRPSLSSNALSSILMGKVAPSHASSLGGVVLRCAIARRLCALPLRGRSALLASVPSACGASPKSAAALRPSSDSCQKSTLPLRKASGAGDCGGDCAAPPAMAR
mmetsp:Transcript_117490/g.262572  ORF Transcript_117490/g.262572 Transcript_117490/m.262572 type:complete len:331 (+) Transcript_117490:1336-2328(+)